MSLFSSFARVVGDSLAAIASIHNFPMPRENHASAALSIQEMGDGPPRTQQDVAEVQFLLSSPSSPLRHRREPRSADYTGDGKGEQGGLPALPPEVVSLILDFAEYYLCKVSFHFAPTTFYDNSNDLYFRTPAFSGELERGFLRKVEFRIVSHDQGFSGEPAHMHGTKEGSWTWWEATLDRPATSAQGQDASTSVDGDKGRAAADDDDNDDDEAAGQGHFVSAASSPFHELAPGADSRRASAASSGTASAATHDAPRPPVAWEEQCRYELTRNLHAVRRFTEHTVTFGPEHPLVQEARRGDSIGIWARTRFPAWRNVVKEVEVKVWQVT
ncbi:uncharacterized protein PFL1_05022 [Pseudozyma flocculosa PF-1]|uniref:Uncharacterized protein n=2 Tax=Pseudozyma flocculosa TaxID=84751 RepID=A0A5C3EWE2_9BASI|nr:uncharacterized protein PFL1_05022 [Pseudozyma flocculosa PF-1]EPQ27484.1 hypothetical protein PFL1_05022 [Pseudozyma flocculosa PF-1]SPO36085.1 uncharacterized protein PSFLO_01556 [Pseudozyma flocculosa]